ncbi:hypothetical protein QYE76_038308 [Lolium multiflorum]|uniref:Uncharacterized protein n=1 Tax=Lolium multiflorum TaxID=4521 RepID=A0AAD8WR14_LOLMU|nr:hypothetical protein QYE76_038308 [Lolium multiflorum]
MILLNPPRATSPSSARTDPLQRDHGGPLAHQRERRRGGEEERALLFCPIGSARDWLLPAAPWHEQLHLCFKEEGVLGLLVLLQPAGPQDLVSRGEEQGRSCERALLYSLIWTLTDMLHVWSGSTIVDQIDLQEQVKMLGGEVALSTSSLKRLLEPAANNLDDSQIHAGGVGCVDGCILPRVLLRGLAQSLGSVLAASSDGLIGNKAALTAGALLAGGDGGRVLHRYQVPGDGDHVLLREASPPWLAQRLEFLSHHIMNALPKWIRRISQDSWRSNSFGEWIHT